MAATVTYAGGLVPTGLGLAPLVLLFVTGRDFPASAFRSGIVGLVWFTRVCVSEQGLQLLDKM